MVWIISSGGSAISTTILSPSIPFDQLAFGNIDGTGTDDIIGYTGSDTAKWRISRDGRGPWQPLTRDLLVIENSSWKGKIVQKPFAVPGTWAPFGRYAY